MKVKASYTVESALIFPLICFLLCAIIIWTLNLYSQVENFYIEQQEKVERKAEAVQWIRIEAVIEYYLHQEEKR